MEVAPVVKYFQTWDSKLSVHISQSIALQCLFYLLGYAGYINSKKEIKNKILFVPYYFLFMNLNVLKAYSYLIKKNNTGVWEKAKRKSA